jgi:hypothetical protein
VRLRVPVLCALASLLIACDARRETTCRFGAEHEVFVTTAAGFDDIALARVGEGHVAVFSDAAGLQLRRLDAHGKPTAAVVRFAERCAGGVDAVSGVRGLLVACLRPGKSAVSVYVVDADGRMVLVRAFGEAGSRARGVSLARTGERVFVGYQDAVVGAGRAYVVQVQLVGDAPAPWPRLVSDPARVAGAPRLAVHDERVFATWSEHSLGADEADGRVMIAEVSRSRSPSVAATVHHPAPEPTLVADAKGLAMVFRDLRADAQRPGLYATRVAPEGKLLGGLLRAARADGSGRPALRACGAHLVAATPRTFAGDAFVGVVGIDLARGAVAGEQQFYEDSREFAQVAADCDGGEGALLMVAERASRGRGTAALHAVSLACQ